MKRWLSPWLLPPVMLGTVLVVTRPVAGAIWLIVSVVAVRFLNAHFGESTPLLNDPFEQIFMDRDKLYFNDSKENYFRKPS